MNLNKINVGIVLLSGIFFLVSLVYNIITDGFDYWSAVFDPRYQSLMFFATLFIFSLMIHLSYNQIADGRDSWLAKFSFDYGTIGLTVLLLLWTLAGFLKYTFPSEDLGFTTKLVTAATATRSAMVAMTSIVIFYIAYLVVTKDDSTVKKATRIILLTLLYIPSMFLIFFSSGLNPFIDIITKFFSRELALFFSIPLIYFLILKGKDLKISRVLGITATICVVAATALLTTTALLAMASYDERPETPLNETATYEALAMHWSEETSDFSLEESITRQFNAAAMNSYGNPSTTRIVFIIMVILYILSLFLIIASSLSGQKS